MNEDPSEIEVRVACLECAVQVAATSEEALKAARSFYDFVMEIDNAQKVIAPIRKLNKNE